MKEYLVELSYTIGTYADNEADAIASAKTDLVATYGNKSGAISELISDCNANILEVN